MKIFSQSAGIYPVLTKITNNLGANVALTVASTYYDGPSVAQGLVGTWFAIGTVTLENAAITRFNCKLYDGTTVMASCSTAQSTGGGYVSATLSGIITTPAGNIRIAVADLLGGGTIVYDVTSFATDSSIRAIRIG